MNVHTITKSLKWTSEILEKKKDYANNVRPGLETARKAMDTKLKASKILSEASFGDDICHFEESELRVGALLGKGGFCDVFEIGEVRLKDGCRPKQNSNVVNTSKNEDREFEWTREMMATNYVREGSARFAIKVVKDDLLYIRDPVERPTTVLSAITDLAIEARYLSVVSHPNIIRVRGFSRCDPFSGGYFIVMDRLVNTLTDQIGEWNRRVKRLTSLSGLCCNNESIDILWEEQLMAAYGLASALNYMHSQKMIYRDLKPDNAGFDVRGDVKLFDFGLATELYPHLEVEDGLYKLTANTGSLRYMAPEVRCCLPYNCKADVHSFGIVFWQICSTTMPYANLSQTQFQDKVMKGELRPSKQSWWPNRDKVFSKMESCWEVKSSKRTQLSAICKWLSSELSIIRGEEEDTTRQKLESRRSRKSLLVGINSSFRVKASNISVRGSGHFEG